MNLRSIALFTVGALAVLLVIPAAANAATPVLTITVTLGPPTTASVASGSGYPGKDALTVTFDATTVATATTGGNGKFSAPFTVPASATPGSHTVSAFDVTGVGASAPFTVQTDWSGARFDPEGTAANPYENVLSVQTAPGLVQAASPQWGAFLHSEPIFAGGMIYAGSDDGTVRAFNPATGQQTWSFVMVGPGPVQSPLAVQSGPGPSSCDIVAVSPGGTVSGLDPRTGQPLWSMAGPGPTSSSPVALVPAVQKKGGGHKGPESPIVVAFDDGSVQRLNGCTGAIDWGDSAIGPGPQSSPAVLPAVLFPNGVIHTIVVVAFGDGSVQALDASTGAVLWSMVGPGPTQAPSAYGSGTTGRVVLGSGSAVMELDAGTGTILWSTETGAMVEGGVAVGPGPQGTGSPLPTAVERLLVGNAAGDVLALDPITGAIQWADRAVGPGPQNSPAVANGVVYVECGPGPQSNGMLHALDAMTGNTLFSADLGAVGPGPQQMPAPAVADGRVLAGDFTGGLRIFALP